MPGVIVHWDHKKAMDAEYVRWKYQRFDYVNRAYEGLMAFVAVDVSIRLLDPVEPVYDSLIAALGYFPGRTPVYVHRDAGTVKVEEYSFPDMPVFIFGPDYGGLEVPEGAECIYIEYADMVMELWADQAMAIVLNAFSNRRG